MLPRAFRLVDDYDFRRVKRIGKAYHAPLFTAVVAPSKNKQDLRFGFIASTKLDKRAVVRNRVVRMLREAVHKILFDLETGFDVVIIPKKALLSSNYEEVNSTVYSTLSKVPLLGSRLTPSSSRS